MREKNRVKSGAIIVLLLAGAALGATPTIAQSVQYLELRPPYQESWNTCEDCGLRVVQANAATGAMAIVLAHQCCSVYWAVADAGVGTAHVVDAGAEAIHYVVEVGALEFDNEQLCSQLDRSPCYAQAQLVVDVSHDACAGCSSSTQRQFSDAFAGNVSLPITMTNANGGSIPIGVARIRVAARVTIDADVCTFILPSGCDADSPMVRAATLAVQVPRIRVELHPPTEPPNHPPTARSDAFDVHAGSSLFVPPPGVLANDEDPEGRALTAIQSSRPWRGELEFHSDGGFRYTPRAGVEGGSDSFTYVASDGQSESPPATVTLHILPAPPRFGVDVSPASQAKTVGPREQATYVLEVRNIGDVSETVRLGAEGSRNGWSHALSTSQLTLAPGEVASVELRVNAGANGSLLVTVRATSQTDPSSSDSATCDTKVSK